MGQINNPLGFVIGHTSKEAKKMILDLFENDDVRILSEDSVTSMEYRPDRVTLWTNNFDIVTLATRG